MDDRLGPTMGIKYFNFLIFMSAIIFKSVEGSMKSWTRFSIIP